MNSKTNVNINGDEYALTRTMINLRISARRLRSNVLYYIEY